MQISIEDSLFCFCLPTSSSPRHHDQKYYQATSYPSSKGQDNHPLQEKPFIGRLEDVGEGKTAELHIHGGNQEELLVHSGDDDGVVGYDGHDDGGGYDDDDHGVVGDGYDDGVGYDGYDGDECDDDVDGGANKNGDADFG